MRLLCGEDLHGALDAVVAVRTSELAHDIGAVRLGWPGTGQVDHVAHDHIAQDAGHAGATMSRATVENQTFINAGASAEEGRGGNWRRIREDAHLGSGFANSGQSKGRRPKFVSCSSAVGISRLGKKLLNEMTCYTRSLRSACVGACPPD